MASTNAFAEFATYWKGVAKHAWRETSRRSIRGTLTQITGIVVAAVLFYRGSRPSDQSGVILGAITTVEGIVIVAVATLAYQFVLAPVQLERASRETIAELRRKLTSPDADLAAEVRRLILDGQSVLDIARHRASQSGGMPGAGFDSVETWRAGAYRALAAHDVAPDILALFSKEGVDRNYDSPWPIPIELSNRVGPVRIQALEGWIGELKSLAATLP